MSELRPILVIDDDPGRLEETLRVMASLRMANRIEIARSDSEARAALERDAPGLVVVSAGRRPATEAVLVSEMRRDARGPAVLAVAPASATQGLRNDHPGLEVAAEPLTREALLEAVENLGLAWGVVGLAAARGSYTPTQN